jgi:transcriptional regulator with XRE-family HTH domain
VRSPRSRSLRSLRTEIATAVRDARVDRQLGQQDLARRAGMKQPAISRLERAHVTPRLEVLQRVAAAMDLAVEVRLVPARR